MSLIMLRVVVRVNQRQKIMVMGVVKDRNLIIVFAMVKRSAKAMMICCVIESRKMMSTKKRRMGIAQDGKEVQVLSSYGLLKTKYAECKQQNVELVQIRDRLRRELEGIKEKKTALLEIAQNGNERTALSSYVVLQTKYAVSSKEKIDLIQMIGKLRGELEDFNRNEE